MVVLLSPSSPLLLASLPLLCLLFPFLFSFYFLFPFDYLSGSVIPKIPSRHALLFHLKWSSTLLFLAFHVPSCLLSISSSPAVYLVFFPPPFPLFFLFCLCFFFRSTSCFSCRRSQDLCRLFACLDFFFGHRDTERGERKGRKRKGRKGHRR